MLFSNKAINRKKSQRERLIHESTSKCAASMTVLSIMPTSRGRDDTRQSISSTWCQREASNGVYSEGGWDPISCGTMHVTTKGIIFMFLISILLFYISEKISTLQRFIPVPSWAPNTCPVEISEQTITPLSDTKDFLVSAYMDQRVNGFDIRIIGIFEKDSVQPLHCLFCCAGQSSRTTPATIRHHPQSFGFPFTPADVMCQIPQNCNPTHVSVLTKQDKNLVLNRTWLPIRNLKTKGSEEKKLQFNFTVCISNLFGDYNNVLQFAQTLEMYRLLGVNRVVIYNTSCGPELDLLLQSYSQEGFVEMVDWPIDKHLNPSHGWLHSEHGGDIHYYGQLITLNECIYRSMDRSRYVLLNDIDEIIMPYQHDNLGSLMNVLQQQQPNVRMVEITSVHEVIKVFGEQYKVPPDVCRIIHVRVALRGSLKLEELNVDKRLWDFTDRLIPRVDDALRRAGLLSSGEKS
ncbi:Beta-1 [Nibea albiflora]|uniref:Beta-1 n=1 Tax=Nibea albiflora TaxID=240163 RepID=A0ACB7FGC9_NIBAL|nr:Beta-1 [Nibea albiflora]